MAHEIGINETKWIEMADENCFLLGEYFGHVHLGSF
jgi:hypothetical protein